MLHNRNAWLPVSLAGLLVAVALLVLLQPQRILANKSAQNPSALTNTVYLPLVLNDVIDGVDLIVTSISITGHAPYVLSPTNFPQPATATMTPRPPPPTPTPLVGTQRQPMPARPADTGGGSCAGTYTLTVMIANRGMMPATDSFWVDLYMDRSSPPSVGQYGYPYFWADGGLTSGASCSFVYPCAYLKLYPGYSVRVYAQVDTDNKISETVETNNVFTATFTATVPIPTPTTIRPTPGPTRTPTPTPYYRWPTIITVTDSLGDVQNYSQGNGNYISSWPYPYPTLVEGQLVTYTVASTNPQSQTLFYRMEYCRALYPATCWEIQPWGTSSVMTWTVPMTAVADTTTVNVYFTDGDPYLRYIDYDDLTKLPYRILPPPPP